ncbi:MAG: TonB-dependent receptor [Steroidobacteraceae bacterium]
MKSATLSSAAAVMLGLAGPAVAAAPAQPPPQMLAAPPSGPDSAPRLQEVIVTAEKRAQNVQRVPASLTAFTSAQLGEMKMDDPSALVSHVPNLQANGIVGGGTPLFALRGVSMLDYSLSQEGPIATYVDQVYEGNIVLMGVDMFDLQRIEVLRGPQGTLYGKNATGGAINFISNPPVFKNEGYLTLGTGNYGREEGNGAFNGVLIKDKLAARVAFTYTKMNGYVRNILPGHHDLQGIDQYGVRVSLLYTPTDRLNFILRYAKSLQDPYNYAIIDGCVTPPISPACTPGGVGFTGYYRTTTGTLSGKPLGPYQIAQNYTPRRHQDDQSVSLTAHWEMDKDLTLTSISSWAEGFLLNPEGTDGAPISVFKIPYYGTTRQVTQELRLTSSYAGPFNYIAGAFYQHEFVYNSTNNYFFTDPSLNVYHNYQDCVASSFGPGVGYSVGSLINAGCSYYNRFDQLSNSWALYTDGSYKITHRIKLHAGIRYNHDNASQKNALSQLRGSDGVPIANLIPGQIVNGVWSPVEALPGSPNYSSIVNATTAQSLHNTAFTGEMGVDFTPTRNSMLYVTYSRGYRAAAFNAQFFFTNTDFSQVPAERLDDIEGGFKTDWLGHRLQVNGSVFDYQYHDQQFIDVRPNGSQPLISLPKSTIYGGELEIAGRPINRLTLHADVGFLHTRIDQGSLGGGSVNISGKQLPYAPSVSGTVSADWAAFSWSGGILTLHIEDTFDSKQYFEFLNEPRLAQKAYDLVNMSATLASANDRWELRGWVNNLTDRLYFTNEVDLQGLGYDYRHVGDPRLYGADVTYRF